MIIRYLFGAEGNCCCEDNNNNYLRLERFDSWTFEGIRSGNVTIMFRGGFRFWRTLDILNTYSYRNYLVVFYFLFFVLEILEMRKAYDC